jgi:hypothetical protein
MHARIELETDLCTTVSKQLTEAFGSNLTSNQYRFFKVSIVNGTSFKLERPL